MAEEKPEAPKGFFAGTIFEGGLFGGSHGAHAAHAEYSVGSYDYFAHNTTFGWLIFDFFAEWGVSRALALFAVLIGLVLILNVEIAHLPLFFVEWLGGTAPVWLPIALVIATWQVWIWYVQGLYISGRDPVVLDIMIPREIEKSPRAMELALTSMSITSGEGSFLHRLWHGQMRTWFSFEYASFGGEVHMYVWCWKNYRETVERALYAQFPDIEIRPVEDYASKFHYDPQKYKVFGNHFIYKQKDAYPIKTYVEFELDKDPKEEYKVDPLAQVFEYLSSLRPGEQVWVQIIFRATGKQDGVVNPKSGVPPWQKRVTEEVKAIQKQASTGDDGKAAFPRPTWKQTEQIRIIERQLGKAPFDVAMRSMYVVDKSVASFNGPTLAGMLGFWKAFDSGYLNGFAPSGGHASFEYPWQDFMDIRDGITARRMLDAYRRRGAFFSPWTIQFHVMTNEVLATLFHFPSSGVSAPGLERISATKAEPPQNLPK